MTNIYETSHLFIYNVKVFFFSPFHIGFLGEIGQLAFN